MSINDYQAPPNLLKDKIILITGAGRGIGRAAALSFAKHGATVILCGRNLATLESVYDEIESKGFAQAAIFPLQLDTQSEQEFSAVKDAVEQEFGRLDGLLHNAAYMAPRTPLPHFKLQEWNKALAINLTAPFLLTKALWPLLQKSEDASIIYSSDSVGRKAKAYWGAYAISKAAGEHFVETLADELDGNNSIRINSIDPGPTQSASRSLAFPAENPEAIACPESIMPAYLFLMGSASKTENGRQFSAQ
jgi:NAD(P)-dependent dehydrogenase (short-subunit alcohol dehydrogenase family)